MATKLYLLYCEPCNYKRITDGTDIGDLYEVKRSKVMSAIPKYDPVSKKVVTKEPKSLPKQFRCPQCGLLIQPRKIKNENIDPGSQKRSEGQ